MPRKRHKARTDRSSIVVNGSVLNARQQIAWRTANDDIESGEFQRIRRGLAVLSGLESELADDREVGAVRDGVNNTIALERTRGEKVEVSKGDGGAGRIRIRTRDGLETLERTGAITPAQYRAGLMYRDLYEAVDPERDLKSQIGDMERRGGVSQPAVRAEVWAERRLRLSALVAALEAKIRAADRNDQAVRVLREVAGHARCISHFIRGGGAQTRYRQALVLALSVCAEYFRLV